MNYNTIYKAAMFKVAGGSAEADKIRSQIDNQITEATEKSMLPGFLKKPQERHTRELTDFIVSPLVNDAESYANRTGLIGGGAIGAGVGGATYAGLGLIPALKKKKLVRAMIALLTGGAAGLYAGNRIGSGAFYDRFNANTAPGTMFKLIMNSPQAQALKQPGYKRLLSGL